MNIKKLLWYVLIILQIIIYLAFLFRGIHSDTLGDIILFFICSSSSISGLLMYLYQCDIKNNSPSKKNIILIIILAWLVTLLLLLSILLLGFIPLILFLAWFLFTTIFIGVNYKFKIRRSTDNYA